MQILLLLCCLFIGFLLARNYYWKKQAQDSLLLLAKKVTHEGTVDLELATTHQIIDELVQRPNNPFILLLPKQERNDVYLDTHSTVPPQMARVFLREAYTQLKRG